MKLVGPANLEDVLSSGINFDEPTLGAIRSNQPFFTWQLETPDDVSAIRSQLQGESGGSDAGRIGAISELYEGWVKWMHCGHPKALDDLERHAQLKRILARGQSFHSRPILLGSEMQIHDGRHRVFALHEFLMGGGILPSVAEVFWNRGVP